MCLAAKMILVKYATQFRLVHPCLRGEHTHVRHYDGCTSSQDFRYDDGRHSADVAIFQDGEIRAIIEVASPYATTGEALQSRVSRVGTKNMWEVDATRVISAYSELQSAEMTVDVEAFSRYKCKICLQAFKKKWKADNSKRTEAREVPVHPTPPAVRTRNVVEFIDDETVRRNGVVLKKRFLPAVCSHSCYTWVEVDTIDTDI